MVHARDSRRPPLPDRLTPAERDFYQELRRLVDIAGYSFRTLEDVTSGNQGFFSKSQWGRWLNGQALPSRRAVQALAGRLGADDIDAGHLIDLWECVFAPSFRRASASAMACPQQLPIAPPGFTGRVAELGFLDDLAERVADGQDSGTLAVAIQGSAGVGKTTLAVHVADLIRSRFPDGQLFVNLRGFDETAAPASAGAVLLDFLVALGAGSDKIPASVDGRAALYRSLLAGRRVLVVLDDARDPDQIRDLLPASPGCLVLVTSRNEMTGLVAEGAYLLRLDPFSAAEARTLLADRVGAARAEQEPDAVDELIGLCARLPLALSVASAYAVAHTQFSLAEIAAEFRSRRLDLLDTGDPATTARSVFARSYQDLPEPAARVFRLLGIHPGPDIALAAAASLAGLPAADTRKALTELTRASLVAEPAPGRFACHNLLGAYAAELARQTDGEGEIAEAEQRLFGHYIDTSRPNVARIYDYILGGNDNFAADRKAAEQIRAVVPELTATTWANRRFHQRAAAWMAEEGVTQFIDVGCGLPTMDNTHEVVRRVNPASRVVYVDCDPVVVLHAQALLTKGDGHGVAAAVRGDVRDPEPILAAAADTGLISMDRPCGVLISAVVHFISEADDPYAALARLMAGTAPGSYLALTHVSADNATGDQVKSVMGVYSSSSASLHPRARADVTRFFDGMELVPPWPGAAAELTGLTQWGLPGPLDSADPDVIVGSLFWAGVARKVS